MKGLGSLVVAMAVLFRTLPAIGRQWREDRAGFLKTLRLIGLYILWGAVAGAALIALMPEPPVGEARALAIAGLVVAWILYGALWLARLVPHYRPVPAFLARRFGLVDLAFLAAGIACLAALLAGRQ